MDNVTLARGAIHSRPESERRARPSSVWPLSPRRYATEPRPNPRVGYDPPPDASILFHCDKPELCNDGKPFVESFGALSGADSDLATHDCRQRISGQSGSLCQTSDM
jgi:hypothetical protein